LETEGYYVKNIVLLEFQPIKFLFNLYIRAINLLKRDKTTFFYNRTYLHYFFTYLYSLYIKISANKDDVVIIQGYTHPPIIFKNKTILLGDWPYRYIFQHFLKRAPSAFEGRAILREDREIERANIAITLFPAVYDFMASNYQNENIHFLGNFVNVDFSFDPLDVSFKQLSNRILFIGRSQYIDGARELVDAINQLRLLGHEICLDIVGIAEAEMPINYDWITFYGYLDKGISDQKNKFYELLKNARVVANTTKDWNGFQALLEGMYFSNPVLIRDNINISKYFDNLSDIAYIVDDNPDSLRNAVKEIFADESLYASKANSARKAVELHTLDLFIKKMVVLINEK
jgi:glycosyltransferase involved in cell wall biosynthesis